MKVLFGIRRFMEVFNYDYIMMHHFITYATGLSLALTPPAVSLDTIHLTAEKWNALTNTIAHLELYQTTLTDILHLLKDDDENDYLIYVIHPDSDRMRHTYLLYKSPNISTLATPREHFRTFLKLTFDSSERLIGHGLVCLSDADFDVLRRQQDARSMHE